MSTFSRRHPGVSVCAALAVAAAALLAGAAGGSGAASAQATGRPNVVVIQTDDQTLQELYATWRTPAGIDARVMPNTLDLIGKKGITFSRYYASSPLCCPSRATLLSGRYAHSNGVISNDQPRGGYYSFQRHPIFRHNLAVWLQQAGYRTIHIGKFLNHYGGQGLSEAEPQVPPGWDDWETFPDENSTHLYYGYDLNVNGTIQGPFGDPSYQQKDDPGCPETPPLIGTCTYSNDALTQRAIDQINTSAGRRFYLQLDYIAPHGDFRAPIGPEPAARHYDSAIDTPLPKDPSFNEGNISDKPTFIRDAAEYLDPAEIRRIRRGYQKSIESLRSVDDGVAKLIEALRAAGQLHNTYVFFLSDNGFFFGQHRLEQAKFLPYEEAVHMPLLVRGPGIEPGSRTGELVANTDLAPTILKLTGARADRRMDGRTLIPFWEDTSRRTRRPILLESFINATDINGDGIPDGRRGRGAGTSIAAPPENYLGVRLGPYAYFEYETGDRELYDLSKDPFEITNRVENQFYDRVQGFLRRQVQRLEGCLGDECRITTGPLPKPGPPIFNDPIGPP
jgi:arylsulfatase A-like enzyme